MQKSAAFKESEILKRRKGVERKHKLLYIESDEYLPNGYTLETLANTKAWRTKKSIQMLADALNHINRIMKSDTRMNVKVKSRYYAPCFALVTPIRVFDSDNMMFWPKAARSGFQGMNNYDPLFGEAIFNDSFHNGIQHEELLRNIQCRTVFMKARTDITEDGILMAALSGEDLEKVAGLIADCQIVRFDCGHSIHTEKPREFVECLENLADTNL